MLSALPIITFMSRPLKSLSSQNTIKIEFYPSAYRTALKLPLVTAKVAAGFPSPADDYIDDAIDLNETLISNPIATFYARVQGDSMVKAGIYDGDLLVVDKSIPCEDKCIVVAMVNGDFTVKRVKIVGDQYYLIAESDDYLPIAITSDMDFEIWGVVTSVIRQLRQ